MRWPAILREANQTCDSGSVSGNPLSGSTCYWLAAIELRGFLAGDDDALGPIRRSIPCSWSSSRSAREQKSVTPRFQGVKQVGVKVIDQRGNELLVVAGLREAAK